MATSKVLPYVLYQFFSAKTHHVTLRKPDIISSKIYLFADGPEIRSSFASVDKMNC